jgi:tetratricopeptide (TPR) repeat protein
MGDLDGAVADFNKAIEINPKFTTAYNNRGRANYKKGDLDAALADYDRAIELNPASHIAYENRAVLRKKRRDFPGALADIDKVIEFKPDLALMWRYRALIKKEAKDYEGALADYEMAIKLDPDSRLVHASRDGVRRLLDCSNAIKLNPKDAQSHNERGAILKSSDLDAAIADFDMAIGIDPHFADAYINRGEANYKKGNLDAALADFNKAIELKPSKVATLYRAIVEKVKRGSMEAPEDLADELYHICEEAIDRESEKPESAAAVKNGVIIPGENSLAIRTDFSDDSAWDSIREAINDPDNEFEAYLDYIDDKAFDGLTVERLPSILSDDSHVTFVLILDRTAITHPEHSILVIDLLDEPGRTFRVIPKAVSNVTNNLSIANMGFEEFVEAADKDGIFRKFE